MSSHGDIHLVDEDGQSVQVNSHLTMVPKLQIGWQQHEGDRPAPPCPCHEWDDITTTAESGLFRVDVSPTVLYTVTTTEAIPCQSIHPATAKGMLETVCPKLQHPSQVEGLIHTEFSKEQRFHLLQLQGDIWGDDELRFQLAKTCKEGPVEQNLQFWDPLLMSSVVHHGTIEIIDSLLTNIGPGTTVLTAVLVDKHWFPIVWRFEQQLVSAFTCGHAHGFSVAINKLHAQVCRAQQVPVTAVRYHCLPFFVDSFCGAVSIVYIEHLIWGSSVSGTIKELKTRHGVFREAFKTSLHQGPG